MTIVLLEYIENKISLKNELLRKSIHLSSSVIPVLYYFISRNTEIIILGILSIAFVLVDLSRIKISFIKTIYLKFLKPVLREHEVENEKILFTGGTYLVIAFLICAVIFPKPLAITSMFVIIICDSFAAIAGKVYGKHFIKNKTMEGSLAFLFSGVIVIFVTPKITNNFVEYYIGIAAIFFTTLFEMLPLKIDDNIIIPVFFGIVYYGLVKIYL